MVGGIRIGRILGIEIRLDWSWVFILLLMTWSLASTFAAWHPLWGPGEQLALAFVGALLFFGSVLLHELAHAAVAKVHRLPVRSITLFLFGGVSNIEREPSSPGSEFLMAIVGPIVSLSLGLVLLMVTQLVTGLPATPVTPLSYVASLGPVESICFWLGAINVAVGLFNLVPAFPLDGGRVLRSAIWGVTRDLNVATRSAAFLGQIVGWAFVLLGIAMSFGAVVPFFGTGVGSGLWTAFIGWFLASAAAQSLRRVVIDEALAGLTVSDLMRRSSVVFPAEATVGDLIHEGFMRTDERAFPVGEGERFVGLVRVDDIRATARDAWDATELRAIMTPLGRLNGVAPDEPLTQVLPRMAHVGIEPLPVLRNGQLVGMLDQRDVARWLELQSGRTGPGRAPPSPPSREALAH